MNYDHCNKLYEHYRKKIFLHLTHRFNVSSFDDYLKRFSFLPSGQWLRDFDNLKITRLPVAFDPEKLVKKFKEHCITYNSPIKPEDGVQRVIYQVSPTLHFETAIWLWVEHDEVQSYASLIVCYHDKEEFLDFSDDLWKIRREGNTEEKSKPSGFLFAVPEEEGSRKYVGKS